MLVIFLILLTKVLADNNEHKYVDLLPDEEKQQFLERVARRIIKDVESKENGQKNSIEISDEQLKQHNEFVKAILKQESDNIRRSKGEDTKTKDDKQEDKQVSEENLDVKPLTTEKIADDSDVGNLDLTLRSGKELPSDETGSEYIKVEIVTDEVPIVKRSIQNVSDKESSVSEETATEAQKNIENKSVSSKSSENIESPKVIGIEKSKDGESSESDAEDIQIKGNPNTRRMMNNETQPESLNIHSSENKSEEYSNITSSNIESTNIESFTTVTITPEVTTESEPVTKNEDDLTDSSSSTVPTTEQYNENDNKDSHTATDVGSTLNNEGTIDLKIIATTYTPLSEFTITKNADLEPVTEITIKPTEKVETTENTKAEVADFTSPPTVFTETESVPTTEIPIESSTIKEENLFKPRAEETQENATSEIINTTVQASVETTTKVHKYKKKVEKSTAFPIVTPSVTTKQPKAKIKQLKLDKTSPSVDNKHFIELEKVYYNNYNKIKPQVGKKYEVYEIPADAPPFVKNEEPVFTEQPYYVPIYNYSPNNAYFNPKNRLGPNPDDDVIPGAFSLYNQDPPELENPEPQDVDMQYSDSERKKFGNSPKHHSIHKIPQQDLSIIKRGHYDSEDYSDPDYYFGRLRSDFQRRLFTSTDDFVPNSDEYQSPFHSIQEMNLKDHVRAVRNIMFRQKFFGPPITVHNNSAEIVEEMSRNKPKHTGGVVFEVMRMDSEESVGKNANIAIDYYFGRTEPEPKDVFQKVGYIRNDNNTKALYVVDDVLKDNVIRYMHILNNENKTQATPEIKAATPHPAYEIEKPPGVYLNQNFNAKKVLAIQRLSAHAIKRPESKLKKHIKKPTRENERNVHKHRYLQHLEDEEYVYKRKKMDDMIHKSKRTNDDVVIGVYLEVLKDMISIDNKALKQYDWLGTTVDIQSSLQKLFELVALTKDAEPIHPADMQILKYVVFLHKLALEIIEATDYGTKLRKKLVLPRNKKKSKEERNMLKEKGLINRVWLYLRKQTPQIKEDDALRNVNKFLMDIEDGLFDLHEAIKNIAKVTKYKNQNWYQNLKDLYLTTDEKHLLELLLHMSVSRLYGLIEESAKNGLEDDYIQYMKRNRRVAKKTLEELLFVMQIVDEINKNGV